MPAHIMSSLVSATKKQSQVTIIPLNKSELKTWKKSAPARQKAWIHTHDFDADAGRVSLIPSTKGGIDCVLWGCANPATFNDQWAYAKLAEQLPAGCYKIEYSLSKHQAHQAALGWALAHYNYDRYKDKKSSQRVAQLVLPRGLDKERLNIELESICLIRDLINTPTNDLGPSHLADFALTLAKKFKAKTKIIVGKNLLKENFPTIHAVGRAAENEPRLIDIRWGKKSHPRLTLVGKGVCFDSGGLGIKTSTGMRLMKKDMGGAAHVLGLGNAIMSLKLPVQLRILVPAVENSISANAFRPGDIIKTRKGITVEIGHTDAEGRLILCDALALADEEKPDLLIDFATLTGAARVALGPDLPALFTKSDSTANEIINEGTAFNDPVWRLPLWQGYVEDLNSSIATLNNAPEGGFAGATMAALFLEKFVEHAKDWVHFDIFGWHAKQRPGRPTGGAAQAILTMLNVLEKRFGRD